MVRGFVAGDIPDYQMSAMLMAVYFKGMDDREITDLTLEMEEAIETLKGRGPEDLTCVCLELAANMLYMAGRGDMEQCRKLAQGAIEDGSALKCLKSMVESQGGDGRYVENPGLFHKAPLNREVKAFETGFITHMDTEGIGVASVMLGAGRNKKEDTIDYSAGILLEKKYGDSVRAVSYTHLMWKQCSTMTFPRMTSTTYTVSAVPAEREGKERHSALLWARRSISSGISSVTARLKSFPRPFRL